MHRNAGFNPFYCTERRTEIYLRLRGDQFGNSDNSMQSLAAQYGSHRIVTRNFGYYNQVMFQPEDVSSPAAYGPRCDAAIDSKSPEQIAALCEELRTRDTDLEPGKARSYFNYCLGNLLSSWSRIEGETASGWRTDAFPVKRSAAIDHLRRALRLDEDSSFPWHQQARTNLGNELAHQRRGVEALFYWKPRFPSRNDADFVSALSRARELMWIGHWLNDESHRNLFHHEAYQQLKELEKNQHVTDHPFVTSTLNADEQIRYLIEFGDAHLGSLENWKDGITPPTDSPDETAYREWCLKRQLFANPIGLITHRWIASVDILQFPDHVVKIGEGPFLSAAFSSLKREYCFARFLAYEGANKIHPSFENADLFLTDTLDTVFLDGATEKLKTSLRVCFGVFDSLAFLLNRYFQCGAAQCEFRPRWIRKNLGHIDNPFLDSLYWLACDLTDTSSIPLAEWKAPQAELGEIRKLRNAIEHGWLRIALGTPGIWKEESDFAQTLSPDDLKRLVMLTLRVTRSALMYLTLAVRYNEENNRKNFAGMTVPIHTPLLDHPNEISEIYSSGEDESE